MKKFTYIFLFSSIVFSSICQSFAQQGITYQAVIYQDQVPLASSTFDMNFSFHIGNQNLYQENHKGSTNDQGLVSLVLGEFEPDVFSRMDWSREGIQLRVEIKSPSGAYNTISDQSLQSVPYSHLAERVKELPAIPLTSLSDVASKEPGRGDILSWDGRQWIATQVSTSSTSAWDKNAQTLQLTYEGGNVGIGTNEASSLLTVQSAYSPSEAVQGQLAVKNMGDGGAYMNFDIPGQASFAMGIENSDSRVWKLGFEENGATMDSRALMIVSPEGEVEIPGGTTIGTDLRVFQDVIIGDELTVQKRVVVKDNLTVEGTTELGTLDAGSIKGSNITANLLYVQEKVCRPGTGVTDMLPIAYGTIAQNGLIVSGTENFQVDANNTGQYTITLPNTFPADSKYTMIATADNIFEFGLPTAGLCSIDVGSNGGKQEFTVYTWQLLPTGTLPVKNGFSFVLYRK
ncbi:MAG: hypothetical protein AAGA10_09105 [Bacteroidota bacterium]